MIQTRFGSHFDIKDIQTCDFSSMHFVTTDQLLEQHKDRVRGQKMVDFIKQNIQIDSRYFAKKDQDALDLARQALARILEKNPEAKNADFLIFAGISNPMPTVCLAALLSDEFGFKNASCWDLKSGCSTGVLALQQSLDWFSKGVSSGVIVCAETFSKFTNPEVLQMSLSTGDGACALFLTRDSVYQPLSAMHGTDSQYFKNTLVPGKYPIQLNEYRPENYLFSFSDKGNTIQALSQYWRASLEELLKAANKKGSDISHYYCHQVDGTKNSEFANLAGIPLSAQTQSFQKYGNMGCPSVFINYHEGIHSPQYSVREDELTVFQAVGGGLSWASLLLQRVSS